jgi:hypothetical protein
MDKSEKKLRTHLTRFAKNFVCECYPKAVEQKKTDILFHMMDWQTDLKELAALYEKPDSYSYKIAEEILLRFLIHASGHILAATELIGVKPCTFDNGPKCKRLRSAKSGRK